MAARNTDPYKKNYRFLMMTIWPEKVRLTDLTQGSLGYRPWVGVTPADPGTVWITGSLT